MTKRPLKNLVVSLWLCLKPFVVRSSSESDTGPEVPLCTIFVCVVRFRKTFRGEVWRRMRSVLCLGSPSVRNSSKCLHVTVVELDPGVAYGEWRTGPGVGTLWLWIVRRRILTRPNRGCLDGNWLSPVLGYRFTKGERWQPTRQESTQGVQEIFKGSLTRDQRGHLRRNPYVEK